MKFHIIWYVIQFCEKDWMIVTNNSVNRTFHGYMVRLHARHDWKIIGSKHLIQFSQATIPLLTAYEMNFFSLQIYVIYATNSSLLQSKWN